jgi:acyl-CoA thioester hydrolase
VSDRQAKPARGDYTFWTREVVRWGDMDSLGHVNNAVYFTYCESVRMAFFLSLRLEDHTAGGQLGPALVTASVDFLQQVHHPATLDVGLRVARVGGKSFTLEYGLFREGEDAPVAGGSSVVAWADYAAGKAQPLPDALRAALAPG